MALNASLFGGHFSVLFIEPGAALKEGGEVREEARTGCTQQKGRCAVCWEWLMG